MSKKLTKKFADEIAAATATEMGGWSTVVEMSAATERATIYFTKDYYIITLTQDGNGQLHLEGDYNEIGQLAVMGKQRLTMDIPSDRNTKPADIVTAIRDYFMPQYTAHVDEVVETERRTYYSTQSKDMLAKELSKMGGRTLSMRSGSQPEVSGDTDRWYAHARVLAPDKVNLVISTDGDLAKKIFDLILKNK